MPRLRGLWSSRLWILAGFLGATTIYSIAATVHGGNQSQLQLLHIALLLIATIIVVTLAATASRRELLLARARSDFIAAVSHDLRMPLAQILIASETLAMQRDRTDAERVSLASSIVRETRRLVGLVDNVLLFSRSGALELTPSLRPVGVDELLDDVVDAVRLAVDDAGQTIEMVGERGLTVTADGRLVRQALVNLVDNALKYGGSGGRIVVGAVASGDFAEVFVQDFGPGLAPEMSERVFERFYRVDKARSRDAGGTGLGLSIVKHIVQVHGGQVWVESTPGQGAKFFFTLPLQKS